MPYNFTPYANTPRQTEPKPINYTPLWVIACGLFLFSGFGAGMVFHHMKYTSHTPPYHDTWILHSGPKDYYILDIEDSDCGFITYELCDTSWWHSKGNVAVKGAPLSHCFQHSQEIERYMSRDSAIIVDSLYRNSKYF